MNLSLYRVSWTDELVPLLYSTIGHDLHTYANITGQMVGSGSTLGAKESTSCLRSKSAHLQL